MATGKAAGSGAGPVTVGMPSLRPLPQFDFSNPRSMETVAAAIQRLLLRIRPLHHQ